MIIIVVVVILLLDVTITIKDIVMKLKEEKKKTAMEFNWLCKITTSILQTSYHIVLLLVCLIAHLVLLPFISSFQFYILHFSLFSPPFISEKKKKEEKNRKTNKQTPIRDIYLNSISSPLEKVKETPIDIVLNKIFMTGQRCIQSITAPLAPIPQLFSLSVEYINYQRMPFLSVFFFYFKTNLTQSRKLLQPPPTQLWLPSL